LRTARGYLVAIEGIDAVGKNTHSGLLFRSLRGLRIPSARMSFPDYDTPIGKEIKSFLSGQRRYPPQLQHLLFAANRWEKRDEIRLRLDEQKVLIVNRYTPSNLAYGSANGLAVEWLSNLEDGLPAADLVVVLEAPPRSLSLRRPGRGKDAYEKSSALQLKAQKAYRQLARQHDWKLVDASGSVGEVQAEVLKTVTDALKRDRAVSS
jgi:dTMP kinase